MKSPKDVIKLAKDSGAQMLDVRFCDLLGTWQHTSYPISELGEGIFKEGFGFDGSSIRGWRAIDNSDMLLVPDPTTARIDPFNEITTICLTANIEDPITREPYSRDPRNIAKKAVAYLKSTKIADTVFIGPEAEFFVFDHVSYDYNSATGYFEVDSEEAAWNTGGQDTQNLGYKIRHKEGYFPLSPSDTLMDIRSEMVLKMQEVGIHVECHHHEVATAGQCEIDMRFEELIPMADQVMWYKYIVKNVALRHGKTATFMPKPIYGDNGSGMHTHQSLWKGGVPLFSGKRYAGMSDMALHYIAGILKHAKALAAFTNPSMNSYKRLVPGYEAPVNLAYSSRNRSAAIRIPMYSPSPKAKRIEVRFPDPVANPYLSFCAMLMAGLDGVQNKLDPGEALDKNIYELSKEEKANVPSMPGSLAEAVDALEADHDFLLKGDVFTPDLIETWIDYKRENEILPMNLRPHPYEYMLYYDA